MSWPGRREGLPIRTVLTPAERRLRPRRPRPAAIVYRRRAGARPAGAVLVTIVRGSHLTLPSPLTRPPPPPPAPRAAAPARRGRRHVAATAGAGDHAARGPRPAGLLRRRPRQRGGADLRRRPRPLDRDGSSATLRRYHAPATFFLVGNRIRYWPRLPACRGHDRCGRRPHVEPRRPAGTCRDAPRPSRSTGPRSVHRVGREDGRPPLPHAVRPRPTAGSATRSRRARCSRSAGASTATTTCRAPRRRRSRPPRRPRAPPRCGSCSSTTSKPR